MGVKRFRQTVPEKKLDKALDRLLEVAPKIQLKRGHRIVFLSDWHISDGSGADDFKGNYDIANQLLDWYIEHRFTGFYIGDMVELWEAKWENIYAAKGNHAIFLKLKALVSGWEQLLRGVWVLGNHDRDAPKYVKEVFPHMLFARALRLTHNGETIAEVYHGNQYDIWNQGGWRTEVANWFVKHIWTWLQCKFGCSSEPQETSPAKNPKKGSDIAKAAVYRAKRRKIWVKMGHTHRPTVACNNSGAGYANIGSGVKERAITCLELVDGELSSVCWDVGGRHEVLVTTLMKSKKGKKNAKRR